MLSGILEECANSGADASPRSRICRILDSIGILEAYKLSPDHSQLFGFTEKEWLTLMHCPISNETVEEETLLFLEEFDALLETKSTAVRAPGTYSTVDSIKWQLEETTRTRSDILAARSALKTELSDYIKDSLALLANLSDILWTHIYGIEESRQRAIGGYFSWIILNLEKKLRCMEYALSIDIWKGYTGFLLQQMRNDLEQERSQFELQLEAKSRAVQEYLSAGKDFAAIAEALVKLNDSITLVETDINHIEITNLPSS